ncbi:hypothetical protein HanIR_Chr08g0374701 [Helianthus annuus]|nr:hypothetical protein HanIR_Chr08g0374701 [Helianthus annuus]
MMNDEEDMISDEKMDDFGLKSTMSDEGWSVPDESCVLIADENEYDG